MLARSHRTSALARSFFVCTLLAAVSGPVITARADEKPNKFEKEIAAFEQKDREKFPDPQGILFVGSSSIRMWDTAKGFPNLPTINRGFGGSQIEDAVFFVDRIVTPYKPRTIVFYSGENDLASGKSAEKVLADFRAFVEKVHAKLPETKIIFMSLKHSQSRRAQMDVQKKANALVADFIKTDKRLQFVDVVHAMLDDQGEPKPELFKADRLHPSEACYKIWEKILTPVLEAKAG